MSLGPANGGTARARYGMTKVKICGLSRVEDALVAAEAGADMLGFVFAESGRKVEPETARAIIGEVRRHSAILMVGVFVNESPIEMNRVATFCDLDLVQLSGDEDAKIVAAVERPAIKTIHVLAEETAGALQERASATTAGILHLDTARTGAYGGTGAAFDWAQAPALDRPILLAGGLHAGNVGEAIRKARPWGVDVSSGVETAGVKDQSKIRAFVAAAKSPVR